MNKTPQSVQEFLRAIGSVGGKNTWDKMTPEQKKAKLEKMNKARKNKVIKLSTN